MIFPKTDIGLLWLFVTTSTEVEDTFTGIGSVEESIVAVDIVLCILLSLSNDLLLSPSTLAARYAQVVVK